MKIEKEAGEPFDNTKRGSGLLIDIIIHTMWSGVEVVLNHTLVIHCMCKDVLGSLLNLNKETKHNRNYFG